MSASSQEKMRRGVCTLFPLGTGKSLARGTYSRPSLHRASAESKEFAGTHSHPSLHRASAESPPCPQPSLSAVLSAESPPHREERGPSSAAPRQRISASCQSRSRCHRDMLQQLIESWKKSCSSINSIYYFRVGQFVFAQLNLDLDKTFLKCCTKKKGRRTRTKDSS